MAQLAGRLQEEIATRRMLVSRCLAVSFVLTAATTTSFHKGTLFSTLLFLLGLVLAGVAAGGRIWCCQYISGYKAARLVTTGPYSLTRNPLYFFSLLGVGGLGLAAESVLLALIMSAGFLLAYQCVIKQEERVLRMQFPTEFDEYCKRTPEVAPQPGDVH